MHRRRVMSRPQTARVFIVLGAIALALIQADAGMAGWPPASSFVVYPEEINVPQDSTTQEVLRQGHAGLRAFRKRHAGWKATVDPSTGSLDRAFGEGIDLGSDDGSAAVGERIGRDLLARHPGLIAPGVEGPAASLRFNPEASRQLAGGKTRFLRFEQVKDSLPVLGSSLTIGVREGKAVLLATRALGPVSASSKPRLEAADALVAVADYLARGDAGESLVMKSEGTLAFYPRLEKHGIPQKLRHHLVWMIAVKPEEAPFFEWHVAYVDAHDGDVLAFFPEFQAAASCAADPNQARASVLGGVRPNRADDPESIQLLPYSQVTLDGRLLASDINGRFPYTPGSAASSLDGRLFKMRCDNCANPPEPSAQAGESGDIDFGTGGTSSSPPILGNGTSTPADRTAFFHANRTRQFLSKWNNAFPDEITVFVNANWTCSAFSYGYDLILFYGDSTCHNTGEIRDVVHHELGHTWDRFDGNGVTDWAMSEWKGDLLAMLIGGDACVAESFRISGGPTSGCSGVREVDEKALGRSNHPPSVMCPTCPVLTKASNDCGGADHCLGEISGQMTVHLKNNLMTGTDYATGAPLPAGNPGFSVEQTRWLLERLLLAGGPPMETWDPAAAGVSIYDAVMVMDDDDGNLANGTPHAAYINNAFGHHGIAESVQVGDSSNCAALLDPLVSAVPDREPVTGLPRVRIEWTPMGGATSFDVYRNTRAGDGFLPVAQDVSAGPVFDLGVQAGGVYRYFVAAVRKSGCAASSPGANIVTVTMSEPELRIASRVVTEVAGASDGDGRIEPGERVSVLVTLREVSGFSGATGVTASLTGFSPFSPVTASGPISFGTVPAGGSTPAAAPFEVFVGPSEACGGRVPLVLSASGIEGCWQQALAIPIALAGCADSASAFVEVVPGSVQVAAPGGGDADGIADNCESTTVSYQIRNTGSLPSGPATSIASTSHPGVTFSPAPTCATGNLSAGATFPCQFSFTLGSATQAGVPFTLTADSAANPAPAVRQVVLNAESNPPVFSTVSYGFDGSLQGWTGQQFAISTARVGSGSHSAHSGSLTQPSICGKLTSPPLLLRAAAASTLAFRFYAMIQPVAFDRANVHIIDVDTGQHTLVAPATGTAYNASGNDQSGLCHNESQAGWGGLLGGFNSVTFNLSAFAGRRIQVEINYDTDESDNREGIYIDDLTISNATTATQPADLQGNACTVPEVSAAGVPTQLDVVRLPGDTTRFTWQNLGSGFQYNLYAGSIGSWYSHGAGQVACSGVGSGITCGGGTCSLDRAGASLPAGNLYFLVTGTAYGAEGTSGFASGGAERAPAQSTCAP